MENELNWWKVMDSCLWGQLSCLSKERRGGSEAEKKKFPNWSAKRDGQLQRGAEISFYSQASFCARVERSDEWYLSPWGHGGIEVGTEYLKIWGMCWWLNKCRQMLVPNSLKKHFYFLMLGVASVRSRGIALGTDQDVWVGGRAGVVKNDQGGQIIGILQRAKYHNTVLLSVCSGKNIYLTWKSCTIMSIFSFPISWGSLKSSGWNKTSQSGQNVRWLHITSLNNLKWSEMDHIIIITIILRLCYFFMRDWEK